MSPPDSMDLEVEDRKRGGISTVWIVPILAALIGGAVAWQSLSERGPEVEIRFTEAQGVRAGKTEIKHRDVVVGLVEDVSFGEGLEEVVVTARMEPEIEPFLGETTDFWIVSANVSGTNLTGLSTILSGAYIEVDWSRPPSSSRREFEGRDVPPLTPPGAQGRHVRLTSPDAGSASVGAPIYYRKLKVGQIESRELSEDFRQVTYTAFIEAPYDQLIGASTHFWNASGVTVVAGTDGLALKLESLQSLIAGGVAFDRIGLALSDAPLADDPVFPLYADREAAVDSRYSADEDENIFFMAKFEDSINGLEPGAPIEWQGIRIGTVADIVLNVGAEPSEAFIYVVLSLEPNRIGASDETLEAGLAGLNRWVESGMRVQLASGNILTGRKLVRFVDGVGVEKAEIDFSATPYPELPTAPGGLGAAQQNVEDIIETVSDLPLDQLFGAAITLLNDADALLANPDTQQLPGDLSNALEALGAAAVNIDEASQNLPRLIDNLNQIAMAGETTLSGLSPDSELYVDLTRAVGDLRDAARSLAALSSRLEENPNALITGR
ncbi:MAG: MlaD family protein [Pseudomonadota bacterium]